MAAFSEWVGWRLGSAGMQRHVGHVLCPSNLRASSFPSASPRGFYSRDAECLHGGTGLFRVQILLAYLGLGLERAQRNSTVSYGSSRSQCHARIKAGDYTRCDYQGAVHRGLPMEQSIPEAQVLTWTPRGPDST